MDIDSNLREQRGIICSLTVAENSDIPFDEDDVSRLVELCYAMDEWLTSGGHKPKPWCDRRSP